MKYTDIKEGRLQEELNVELQVGQRFYQEGEYDEAVRRFESILAKDPYNSDAAVLLRQAKGRLLRMEQIPPLRDQAAAAVAAGNLAAASDLYHRILEINPRDAEAGVRIAELEQRMKNQARVAELMAEAQRAFERGRYRDASALWEEVFGLDPANDEARQGYEKAQARLTGVPELDDLLEQADQHFERQEYMEAIALWEKILQAQPENESLRTQIETARAMSALAEQLDAWRRQARTLVAQGDFEEAIKVWQRILDYQPFDEEAEEGMAKAREELRK